MFCFNFIYILEYAVKKIFRVHLSFIEILLVKNKYTILWLVTKIKSEIINVKIWQQIESETIYDNPVIGLYFNEISNKFLVPYISIFYQNKY